MLERQLRWRWNFSLKKSSTLALNDMYYPSLYQKRISIVISLGNITFPLVRLFENWKVSKEPHSKFYVRGVALGLTGDSSRPQLRLHQQGEWIASLSVYQQQRHLKRVSGQKSWKASWWPMMKRCFPIWEEQDVRKTFPYYQWSLKKSADSRLCRHENRVLDKALSQPNLAIFSLSPIYIKCDKRFLMNTFASLIPLSRLILHGRYYL